MGWYHSCNLSQKQRRQGSVNNYRPMAETKPHFRRRRSYLDRTNIILISAFAVLAIATAVVAFIAVRNIIDSWNLTEIPGSPKISEGTPVPGAEILEATRSVVLQPPGGPTAQPWDGASRVNILFMGLDYRDWMAGDIPRTDTMMLFTIDPLSKTAGMLSIPRDMWVNIPGFEYNKINTAYFLGESYKLPGGGPALAVSTVELFLGVPVHYYAQVDFGTFVRLIDEIGCIDVHVREKIHVAIVGNPDGFDLEEGVQPMCGEVALAYARARYTEGDDFARAQRQQEVIIAIRNQVLNFNKLPDLIAKAPTLYKELSSGVRTNLTLDEAIRLALLGSQIDLDNIRKAVIGTDAVMLGTSPDELSILIPIPDKVRITRDSIFTIGGPVGPMAVAEDPVKLMEAEQTRISVQNGTTQAGLATRTAQWFRSLGLNVVEETSADQIYNSSLIIVYTGKPYTIKYLAETMDISTSRIYNRYNPDSQVDVAVILGTDWINNQLLP